MKKSGLCRFLLVAGLVGTTMSDTFAACKVNLSGRFVVDQSNVNGLVFQLQQDSGNKITGNVVGDGKTATVSGTVGINDRSADMIVSWSNGQKGRYVWHIDENGHMSSGQTTDVNNPGSSALLSSNSNFCQ